MEFFVLFIYRKKNEIDSILFIFFNVLILVLCIYKYIIRFVSKLNYFRLRVFNNLVIVRGLDFFIMFKNGFDMDGLI